MQQMVLNTRRFKRMYWRDVVKRRHRQQVGNYLTGGTPAEGQRNKAGRTAERRFRLLQAATTKKYLFRLVIWRWRKVSLAEGRQNLIKWGEWRP